MAESKKKTNTTKKSTNKNVKKTTTKKPVSKTTKPVSKKTTTKKTTTKKPVNKTTKTTSKKPVVKKVVEEVKTEEKVVEEPKKVEVKKEEPKKDVKTLENKEDNKAEINEYVNILFDRKEEKAKSIIFKILVFIIIVSVIGMGVLFFLDNKDKIVDKFLNNEHVKRVMNKHDEPKKKEKKKAKEVQIVNTDKIAILTFHRITSEETKNKYFKDNEWVQSADMFEKQMKYLHDNGYKTINLDEFNCWYDGECKYDKKTVVLTFDDGDLSFYYIAAPILKKYNFKATMFIVGSRTTDKEQIEFSDTKRLFISKETIEKSKQEYPNIYYESHSYNFHDSNNKKKAYAMTRVELQEDFDNMKSFNTKYIAYPFGIYDEALLEKTEQNGYVMGFTFKQYDYATRESKRFEIPRFKINGESNVETIEKIVNY